MMKRWIEALGSMWALAVFSYRTFVAPWPPFTLFMAASALVAVVTPTLIVRATSGLIDAIARTAGPSPDEAPVGELLGPVLPWLAILLAARAVEGLLQLDPLHRFLGQKLGLHSMARLEDILYEKAVSLRLEWFEYPRYYDGLQRVTEPSGPMNEMGQSWQLLQAQNVLVTVCVRASGPVRSAAPGSSGPGQPARIHPPCALQVSLAPGDRVWPAPVPRYRTPGSPIGASCRAPALSLRDALSVQEGMDTDARADPV